MAEIMDEMVRLNLGWDVLDSHLSFALVREVMIQARCIRPIDGDYCVLYNPDSYMVCVCMVLANEGVRAEAYSIITMAFKRWGNSALEQHTPELVEVHMDTGENVINI